MKVIHRVVLSLSTVTALVIPSSAQALEHVDKWAVDGVEAARQAGLEPAALAGADAAAPVTRAEFAAIAIATYEAVTGRQAAAETAPAFPDCDDPAVAAASRLGLVSGRSDGTFAPDAAINRQELCVMLAGVARAAGLEADPESDLSRFPDADMVDWWALESVTAMTGLGIMNGVSTYGALTLDPFGMAARQQALLLSGRFVEVFRAQVPEPEPTDDPSTAIPDVREDNFTQLLKEADVAKFQQIFGESDTCFLTKTQAEAFMETFTVPVWQLSEESGEKQSSTMQLTMHRTLVPTVRQIFQEIYEGEEQFPIKNIGGYAWRQSERSEHRQGTAIDINWEENYEAEQNEDGSLTAITGEYWKPGEDPFSIPEDGDVVRIFKKYGFSWGGDAWSSKRDYMHFSYFGR